MASSPLCSVRGRAPLWPALIVVGCALSIAGLATQPRVARADPQPALSVSLKPNSGSGSTTAYVVTATGFPTQVAYTETMGDGSAIPPATGQTSASGGFTLYWNLEATTKYCGTITAKAGTATASASFWVAPASDPQSATACGSGGSATPASTAPASAGTTPPATNATPAATQSPAPLPTTVPSTGSTHSRLQSILAAIPWRWIGIGGAALVVLIVVVVAANARGNRPPTPAERTSARRAAVMGAASRPGYGSARQRAAQWQGPVMGGAQTRRWSDEPAPIPRGAGGARQWRERDPDHYQGNQRRPSEADQRWTRSQPGSRTVRDATAARARAPRRNADWDEWRGRQ
jgi:hypothetical protein